MRADATDAERKLWSVLRNGHVEGYKFRRQVPVGRYIADFLCAERKLIVEADGGQHCAETDAARTHFLESQGYRVMRFWNTEILANPDGVVRTIASQLATQGAYHAV